MNNLSEVKQIKFEPSTTTSTADRDTPIKIEIGHYKKEIDDLNYSGIDIKTEPNEDESDYSNMATTCYNMEILPADIKLEMNEQLIKSEHENFEEEMLSDPLNVKKQIIENVGEHSPSEAHAERKTVMMDEGQLNLSQKHRHSIRYQQLVRNKDDYKKKKHTCNSCNYTFRQKSDLDNHLRIHSGDKPFICNVCKKSFNQKSNLYNHMLIHTGEKSHVCNICKKLFRRKAHLQQHMLYHFGEKPYLCDICNKSFARNSDLIKHKRVHTGERPYSCELCCISFTQSSALNTHKKRMHKN